MQSFGYLRPKSLIRCRCDYLSNICLNSALTRCLSPSRLFPPELLGSQPPGRTPSIVSAHSSTTSFSPQLFTCHVPFMSDLQQALWHLWTLVPTVSALLLQACQSVTKLICFLVSSHNFIWTTPKLKAMGWSPEL